MIDYIAAFIISTSSIFFVGGIIIGKNHIIHLARNGGEEKYPKKIQNAVNEYRDNKRHIIESWSEK